MTASVLQQLAKQGPCQPKSSRKPLWWHHARSLLQAIMPAHTYVLRLLAGHRSSW